jgi:formate hydrogenlyase subunit 3/multisubunit Na+/H+ antiporter MnhD subunit
MIFFGLFGQNPWVAAILGLSIILVVIYMLRFMQKVYFGAPTAFQSSWIDIGTKELLIAAPLVALILWIGIYPAPVLKEIRGWAEINATFSPVRNASYAMAVDEEIVFPIAEETGIADGALQPGKSVAVIFAQSLNPAIEKIVTLAHGEPAK